MAEETGARCGECGEPMQRRRRWQRYCSTECRLRAFWRRRLNKPNDASGLASDREAR